MLTCRDCVELLLEFVSGELHADKCAGIRQHLDRCPPCVTYVETYQITIRCTRQLSPVSLPPDVEQRLLAALRELGEPRGEPRGEPGA